MLDDDRDAANESIGSPSDAIAALNLKDLAYDTFRTELPDLLVPATRLFALSASTSVKSCSISCNTSEYCLAKYFFTRPFLKSPST